MRFIRMFALVDCNNFFVSCERVFNPKLKDKPVLVLSNNDGCVIARSHEAKQLGVPMGVPVFKMGHLIKQHRIQVLSSNFELYGDMSQRVMQILQQWTPRMEIYSIDEAFLSLYGSPAEYMRFAAHVRAQVLQWTGIPVSVGVAPSKTLAKLANYLAKTISPTGVFSLADAATRTMYLQQLAITEVWGVGRQLAPTLQRLGIQTAYDLSCYPPKHLRQRFGVTVERMALELQGSSCLGLDAARAKQSIQSSRSFGRPVLTREELFAAISTYAVKACEKLRSEGQLAQTLCVYLRTSRFCEDSARYSRDKTEGLVIPSDDSRIIITQAKRMIADLFVKGYSYAKCGIILMNLIDSKQRQQDLFDKIGQSYQGKLMKTIDSINQKYGKSSLVFAAEGLSKPWMMKSNAKTPQYTTQWQDLLCVN